MEPHPPRVRAVMYHAGRFLLVQHNHRLPENQGKWGTPGGGVEPHDVDLHEALRREMREEFQVEVTVAGFIATYEYKNREHHVFLVFPVQPHFVINPAEIVAYRWYTLEEVAALDAAGLLHTGFELDAIRQALPLLPCD